MQDLRGIYICNQIKLLGRDKALTVMLYTEIERVKKHYEEKYE